MGRLHWQFEHTYQNACRNARSSAISEGLNVRHQHLAIPLPGNHAERSREPGAPAAGCRAAQGSLASPRSNRAPRHLVVAARLAARPGRRWGTPRWAAIPAARHALMPLRRVAVRARARAQSAAVIVHRLCGRSSLSLAKYLDDHARPAPSSWMVRAPPTRSPPREGHAYHATARPNRSRLRAEHEGSGRRR